MTSSTRVAALVLLASGLSAMTAVAATNVTCDVAVRLGYQTSEQHLGGDKISEWSAPLVGVEGILGFSPSPIPTLRLEGRGALDVLADSGKLYTDSAGEHMDYTATQWRFKAEGDAGLVLGNPKLSLMPFAGLGFRMWSWGDPSPDFLHVESWSAIYGSFGARGDVQVGSARLYGRVAAQVPVKETVSIEGHENDLEYDSTTMIEAELGMVTGRLLLGLWGEWLRYSSDNSSSINYSSDDSSSISLTGLSEDIVITTVGAKIGVAF